VVLKCPLYLTRALIEPMVKNRYGRILFFFGGGAIFARGSGRTHLSAAKMGLPGDHQGRRLDLRKRTAGIGVTSRTDRRPGDEFWRLTSGS
jgi:hypothetical protein